MRVAECPRPSLSVSDWAAISKNRGPVPTFLTAIDTIHQTPRALVESNVGDELMSVTMNANFPSTTSPPIPAGAEVL